MTKVAILILAHKNPGQIRKFINQFNKDKFDIYLHFDLKTKLTELENTKITPEGLIELRTELAKIKEVDIAQIPVELNEIE